MCSACCLICLFVLFASKCEHISVWFFLNSIIATPWLIANLLAYGLANLNVCHWIDTWCEWIRFLDVLFAIIRPKTRLLGVCSKFAFWSSIGDAFIDTSSLFRCVQGEVPFFCSIRLLVSNHIVSIRKGFERRWAAAFPGRILWSSCFRSEKPMKLLT